MQKKDCLIEFHNVSKSFNKKTVLDKISFRIDEGDIFGLLGRSGSGKSTLLKILLGIYKPDSGKVFFKGKDITGDAAYLKRIVGLTTQENSFYERLTVFENMKYYANLYDLRGNELSYHIKEILKSVELDNAVTTIADNLSGGMKRRLDFAISMLHNPELLILDEPTTGLDPILVNQFWNIVRETAKKGKTVIVISHIFPEIKENCNKACILSRGKAKIIEISQNIDLYKEFVETTK